MSNKPNLEGNCENIDCNRPLHRKTAHTLFNENINEYQAICRFCFIKNPAYGRKKVTQ